MGAQADLIKDVYAAFGRGDIPAVLDLLAEDVQWSAPAALPHGGQFHGRSGVAQFFQGLGAEWEALALDVENVSEAGGNLVIGIARADGTRRSGAPCGYGAVHVFTIHDGQITRFREYTDLDAPLQ